MSESRFFSRAFFPNSSRYRGTVVSSSTRIGGGGVDPRKQLILWLVGTAVSAACAYWASWKQQRSMAVAGALRATHIKTLSDAANCLARLHEVRADCRPQYSPATITELLDCVYAHLKGQLWA